MFQHSSSSTLVVFLFIPSFFVKKETVFQKITHSNGSEMRKKKTFCIGMMNRDRSWRREKIEKEDWEFVERRKRRYMGEKRCFWSGCQKIDLWAFFSFCLWEKEKVLSCSLHIYFCCFPQTEMDEEAIWILNVQLTIWTVVFDSCNFFPWNYFLCETESLTQTFQSSLPLKFRVWI